MFAGHVGAALAIGRAERCVNVGVFVTAALLQVLAPPPPSAVAMAASSLVTLVLVCALFVWLGRPPSINGAST
jgi:hypothetical protein